MKPGQDVDPTALLRAIADARGRAVGAQPSAHLELKRRYDASYWLDKSPEWLPRVAEIDATLAGGAPWLELEVQLASGPEEVYRYLPFAAYVYVDGRACSVVEFTAAHQERLAIVSAPVGRPFTISIVSELCAPAGQIDNRELAILLREIRVGGKGVAPAPEATSSELGAFAQRANPLVDKLPQPVFVVGAYRSGTSILTWAVGQHPNVWPLDETRWLQLLGSGALAAYAMGTDATVQYFDTYDVSRAEYMAYMGCAIDQFMMTTSKRRADEVSLKRLSGLAPRYDSRFQLRRSALTPKQRWVDGTPENADCILLLHELFPAARFVCILRDPRDVIASMLHFHRAGGSPMDADTAASMWLQRTRSCLLAYRALGPQLVHVVPYEDLEKPTETLRSLFRFLDEPDFPTAAETFDRRINSSRLGDEERQEAYREIEETTAAEEAAAMYAQFRALILEPWDYDRAAHDNLSEMQSEIVHRMVEAIV